MLNVLVQSYKCNNCLQIIFTEERIDSKHRNESDEEDRKLKAEVTDLRFLLYYCSTVTNLTVWLMFSSLNGPFNAGYQGSSFTNNDPDSWYSGFYLIECSMIIYGWWECPSHLWISFLSAHPSLLLLNTARCDVVRTSQNHSVL